MASCYEDLRGSGMGFPSRHEWWRSHGGRRRGRPLRRHGGWLEEASGRLLKCAACGSSIDAYCVDLASGAESWLIQEVGSGDGGWSDFMEQLSSALIALPLRLQFRVAGFLLALIGLIFFSSAAS
jgi:hypothetical protein